MSHLLNNMSEEEKNSILEQHYIAKNKQIINEQNNDNLSIKDLSTQGGLKTNLSPYLSQKEFDTKYGQSTGPGVKMGEKTFMTPVIMDGSLFLNGVDKIDTNSSEFKKGVDSIKDLLNKTNNKNVTITVEGGASAVGSKEGYNNEALAKRRAQNFIKEVSSMFPTVKFENPTNKVGVATKKNSPEANKEQYVKISFDAPGLTFPRIGPAIDNTQLVMRNTTRPKRKDGETVTTTELVNVCFCLPANLVKSFTEVVIKNGGKKGGECIPS